MYPTRGGARPLSSREHRGADPRREMRCFLVCSSWAQLDNMNTVGFLEVKHTVALPEVRKHNVRKNKCATRRLPRKKKKSTVCVRKGKKNAARGVPGSLLNAVLCWTPRISPHDPPLKAVQDFFDNRPRDPAGLSTGTSSTPRYSPVTSLDSPWTSRNCALRGSPPSVPRRRSPWNSRHGFSPRRTRPW